MFQIFERKQICMVAICLATTLLSNALFGDETLRTVTLTGMPAPGISPDTLFTRGFRNPVINNQGQVSIHAFIEGPEINTNNNNGIWSEGGGSGLELIAQIGDVAPSTNGASFDRLGTPLLDNQGNVFFAGGITGSKVAVINDTGIWKKDAETNELKLLAHENARAPGGEGSLFSNLGDNLTINSLGQLAFHGTLRGQNVTSSNDGAIWAQDLNGQLQLIAREGSQLDVSDDPAISDIRTIQTLSFTTGSNNNDGRQSAFNDLGQLAYTASFTDGSQGVFVSNLVAIPEPSSLAICSIAAAFPFVTRQVTRQAI